METVINSFAKNKKRVVLLLILLTSLAYWQTLFMYFWIDDNALIYKLQHLNQNIGYWGEGILGSGPYRHIVVQYLPFFPLFKTTPWPYYAVGLLLYFLLTISFYYFILKVFKNSYLALFSSLIIASGYIASETLFGMMNSWQTSRGITMLLLTLYFYWRFMNTKKTKKRLIYYLLSVGLFFLSVDTVFIRAHGIVFVMFAWDWIFYPTKKTFGSIISFVSRQIPFIYIHYKIYFAGSGYIKQFGLFQIFKIALVEKKWYLLTIPLQDMGNLFLPDKITVVLENLAFRFLHIPHEYALGSTISGVLFILLFLLGYLKYRRCEPELSRILLFSQIWIAANFGVYYARESFNSLGSTHRYFSYSFLGLALFWSVWSYLLGQERKIFRHLPLFIISLYLVMGWSYQYQFNQKRSIPIKKFYRSFTRSLPQIPKGAVIYFNLANVKEIRNEFNGFFGGMFSEGANLAIYSKGIDYMKDFIVTYQFDDAVKGLQDKNLQDKVFAFYYGQEGLLNITQEVRKWVSEPQSLNLEPAQESYSTNLVKLQNGYYQGRIPEIVMTPSQPSPSFVPSSLKFSLRIDPMVPQFPYNSEGVNLNLKSGERKKYFNYLLTREDYYKKAKASSNSFWKEQTVGKVIDQRLDTAWRGNRGYWDDYAKGRVKGYEYLEVDLGLVREVGAVLWATAQKPLTPTLYKILTSTDDSSWQTVKEVQKYQTFVEGTEIIDSFSPVKARYVRMLIEKTYGDDGPEISEFEVIDKAYIDLDRNLLRQIEADPFTDIRNQAEYYETLDFARKNSSFNLAWITQEETKRGITNYLNINLISDGLFHDYTIDLPVGGRYWEAFWIEGIKIPAVITIKSPRLIYSKLVAN